jgi:hypothetical protein
LGTLLLDEHGNTIKDLDGKDITCVGTWISPENVEQYRSAISTLHKARNMIGAYQSLAQTALSWIGWRDTMAADSIVEMPGCGAQEIQITA